MSRHYNLPSEQRATQDRVDQFNADERIWRSLQSKRRLRRRASRDLPEELHKTLDLREYSAARPPQDCIGNF